MPDESVSTDELVIVLSKLDKGIRVRPSVLAADVLERLPLHGVLRSDLAELVLDNLSNLLDTEGVLVGGSTIVLPSLLLCQRIKGAESHGRGEGKQDEAERELHGAGCRDGRLKGGKSENDVIG